jgi:hypothetical protein
MDGGADLTSPDCPYIFVLVYLIDKEKVESAQTVYFSGRNADIDLLGSLVHDIAAAEQASNGYRPPLLRDVPVPSDGPRPVPHPIADSAVIGGPSKILRAADIAEIRRRLLRRNRNGDWRLLFQLSTDGCSYQTMYDKVRQCSPVVIAVKTEAGDRIGAFLSCELKISRGFIGQPDSFVWRVRAGVEFFGGSERPANRFFVACTADEIIVGGGDSAAIIIGDALMTGRSQRCATYGSPMLTEKERFRVIDFEVWAVRSE